MAEHRDRTFHNRTLIIDGERFYGCRFINADLRYKGTALSDVQGCRFEGYFNLEIDGQGAGAVEIARMLDRELAGCGYNLDLVVLLAQRVEQVWRFHTLLSLLPRS